MGKKKTRRRQAHEIEDEIEKNEEERYKKVSEQSNSEIEKLKQSKSRSKAGFTRARHSLLQLLDEDLPSRKQLREARHDLSSLLDKAMDIMSSLSDKYEEKNDVVNIEKLSR